MSVARLPTGAYLGTGIGSEGSLTLFKPHGQFDRAIGRVGDGPGEFRNPVSIGLGAGDSIFVVDQGTRRVSILSKQGAFVRALGTSQVEPQDVLELANRNLLLSGRSFSREGAGFALHLLSRDASGARPIGEPLRAYDRSNRFDIYREIAVARDSTLWVSRINRYVLERRSASGALLGVLERKAEWFPPWSTNHLPVDEPSNPTVRRIATDANGMVWVFLSVSKSPFRALQRPPRPANVRGNERGLPPIADVYNNMDTMIEVLDPRRGALVTFQRISGYLYPMEPFPFTARIERGVDGIDVLRVYRLVLEGLPIPPKGSEVKRTNPQ